MREQKNDKVVDLLYEMFIVMFFGLVISLSVVCYNIIDISSQISVQLMDVSAFAGVY
jgi:hypothetical protein